MVSRRIQIAGAVCVFITVFTVYRNARYMLYSDIPFPPEAKSGLTNTSGAHVTWFSEANYVYHGYSQVEETADHVPPRHVTLVISTSHNGDQNATYWKPVNQTNVVHHHVTSSALKKNALSQGVYKHNVTRFADNKTPHHILLLSYQRSGSSVISSLFGDNSNIFFLYEPLDSIYTALYGLSPGWSVPGDLTINRDGTLRKMPSLEKDSAITFLHNIYECEMDKLPTEFFIHPFWWYFSNWTEMAKPYVSCLRAYGLSDRSFSIIQRSISVYCGRRFGDVRNRQQRCFGKLWPDYRARELETAGVVRGVLRNVRARPHAFYVASLRQMRKKCEFCINKYLKEPCKRTPVRAVKTVRGTMEEAEALLAKDANFKVIHLLRDPRGVTRSRMKATWSRGFYDAHKEDRIAHVYCTTALHDYVTSERLREKYPNRLMQIMLEDFISEPEATLAALSQFLGIPFEADALRKLYKRMKPGFADRWRKELTPNMVDGVNQQCKEFMSAVGIPLF